LNRGKTGGGEGVISGDSLMYTSPGADARIDLVFRIKPGPGNYSTKGNRASALFKVPSNPGLGTSAGGDNSFWGQYLKQTGEKNGQVGSADGHTATVWDPQTWNSARMDSAQASQLYPVAFKSIGQVAADNWQGTYEESDPKGGALGNGGVSPAPLAQQVSLCYVIDLNGPVNSSNICCDPTSCTGLGATYPPAGYPAGTTTFEG
jgi:hypothetical protein